MAAYHRHVLAHPTEWYAENGADLRTGERVASLDDVDADTVGVATGARPRPLPGALPLRTVDDALTLRVRAQAAGSVVVVGGGVIGCEVTASLTETSPSVIACFVNSAVLCSFNSFMIRVL